jgi:hypothetical protein
MDVVSVKTQINAQDLSKVVPAQKIDTAKTSQVTESQTDSVTISNEARALLEDSIKKEYSTLMNGGGTEPPPPPPPPTGPVDN